MDILTITRTLALVMLLIPALTVSTPTQVLPGSNARMHPSWDLDGDGINDCELDGTCDHTVDYSQPRRSKVTPSFDCKTTGLNASEKLVCKDQQLSLLDRKMAQVFGAAKAKGKKAMLSTLKAEQRGWLKGRDDCWKEEDQRQCVVDSYLLRIAELQARYQLVKAAGPIHYTCGESKADEVVVTFFQTLPPTVIAERGDAVSLMYKQTDQDVIRYRGRNEILVNDGTTVKLTWGFEQPEIICREYRARRPE